MFYVLLAFCRFSCLFSGVYAIVHVHYKADGAPFGTVYVMPANALCCCRLPIAISSPLFCRRSSLLCAGVGANTENAEWDCTEAAAAGGCLSTGLFASLETSDFGSLEATDPTDRLVTASAFSFKGMLQSKP